jgi:hypothetical protein
MSAILGYCCVFVRTWTRIDINYPSVLMYLCEVMGRIDINYPSILVCLCEGVDTVMYPLP